MRELTMRHCFRIFYVYRIVFSMKTWIHKRNGTSIGNIAVFISEMIVADTRNTAEMCVMIDGLRRRSERNVQSVWALALYWSACTIPGIARFPQGFSWHQCPDCSWWSSFSSTCHYFLPLIFAVAGDQCALFRGTCVVYVTGAIVTLWIYGFYTWVSAFICIIVHFVSFLCRESIGSVRCTVFGCHCSVRVLTGWDFVAFCGNRDIPTLIWVVL